MRNLTLLTTILLSASMLAAAAQTQSQSPRCKSLEQSLPECQTIGVSAAAAGGALDLLSKDYPIVPIEQTAASVFPSHLVIAAADLDSAQIIALLRRSYAVGKTVAIVGATRDQADRFHRLLRPGEAANCQPANGRTISSLYGLQSSRNRFPPQNSTYCLINLDPRHPASDRRWLRERFGLTPPQPAAGTLTSTSRFIATPKATSSDDPNQFLTGLTGATHCSYKASNNYGAIQMDPYVYTMRNFTDTGCSSCQHVGADYYLVQDNISYSKYSSEVDAFAVAGLGLVDTTDNVTFPAGSYNLEFADPATTTTSESSYTNGSSVTASGSVGVSAEGPNVTVGGSVTTSTEQTYSVPATTIDNTSNLPDATPEWLFTPQSLPVNNDFAANTTWTWFVPRDAYPGGGTGSGETQFYAYSAIYNEPNNFVLLGSGLQSCDVPFPFSDWTVNPPLIQSITPPGSGAAGQTFTINGQYLYPSSVVAVLIDGAAVPQNNFSPTGNTASAIVVILPRDYSAGSSHTVQVNTQFNGVTVFSNNNVPMVVPPSS